MISRVTSLIALAIVPGLTGCGSSSTTDVDARGATVDAGAGAPDAPVATFDAPVATFDAPIARFDAPVATFDAPVATPDAPAGTIDSGTTSACLPQCFMDTMIALASACVPSGTCTTNFSLETFTMTICFENGVKIVSAPSGEAYVTTTKKPGGATCYSMEAISTGETSARVIYRNASGVEVVRVDVPDTRASHLVDYTCASGGGPYRVDLNSPACEAMKPDAGVGQDGGLMCSQSASCTP